MQQDSQGRGVVGRIGRRLRRAVQRADTAPAAQVPSSPPPATGTVRPGSVEELRSLREQIERTKAELQVADEERDTLKAERLALQEKLGQLHGKRVLPRLKVEKTNGVASLVVGARMMQRIHGQADDAAAGLDGAGTVFTDAAQTELFARSHGVHDRVDLAAEPNVVLHAFKGEVPLVELRQGEGVRHLTDEGEDPGSIRPGVPYDPDIPVPETFDEFVSAARTLSAHIPRPYVQIGWRIEPASDAVLTGVDVDPDRVPVLDAEWDEKLGKAFDTGHARMLMQPYRAGALQNRTPDGIFRYEESM